MKKKLTVNTLALGNLRQRKKQYTVLIIGVILAMMFSSAIPFIISCMNSSQQELKFIRQGKQDMIIVNTEENILEEAYKKGANSEDIGKAHLVSFISGDKNDISNGTFAAFLDEKAKELYYIHTIEGNYPEKQGEIAIEKTALLKMGINASAGDTITLYVSKCEKGSVDTKAQKKTYTLTGILEDKRLYYENLDAFSDNRPSEYIPAAFVSEDEAVLFNSDEILTAFIKLNQNNKEAFDNIPREKLIDTSVNYTLGFGSAQSDIGNSRNIFLSLSFLLALLSAFGIINVLNSKIKERRQQIGMLRAVGATKRQISGIFLRETFFICLICTPVSIALSYLSVKILTSFLGDYFVFLPDYKVLLTGAFFGISCIILSSVIPIFGIYKLTPLQAIRDVELMRKFKKKKIKSKNSFNVSRHLAKRRLTFSKLHQISVCVILAITTAISCASLSYYVFVTDENRYHGRYDYSIRDQRASGNTNSFINYSLAGSSMSENERQDVLSLPYVKSVYGTKNATINILINGEYPEYLRLMEIGATSSVSRHKKVNEYVYEKNLSGIPYEEINIHSIVKDIYDGTIPAEPSESYKHVKNTADYTEKIFNLPLTAKNADEILTLSDSIISGRIDIEKLNSGEEIILKAPEKIALQSNEHSSGYSYAQILNLSKSEYNMKLQKNSPENTISIVDCPYKAGDELTLSLLYKDHDGSIKREDRKVKIGAISDSENTTGIEIITSIEGLSVFNCDFDYRSLEVTLSEECTYAMNEFLMNTLLSRFPGMGIMSLYGMKTSDNKSLTTAALSIIATISVLISIGISLINTSVSAQILESKKTLGTLRAVGASEKELIHSYLYQILHLLLWGISTGAVLYLTGFVIIRNVWSSGNRLELILWPILLLFIIVFSILFINIKVKMKAVTKHSIVENIREL